MAEPHTEALPPFSALIAAVRQEGETFSVSLPANWLQGRTAYYLWPDKPNFVRHFDGRLVAGARPGTPGAGPAMRVWLRHSEEAAPGGIVSLPTLADALPPAAVILFPERAPISTMTWSIDVLDPAPASPTGCWLVQCTAETARPHAKHYDRGLRAAAGTAFLAGLDADKEEALEFLRRMGR